MLVMSAKVVAILPGAVKKIESEGGLVLSGRALFLSAHCQLDLDESLDHDFGI